MNIVHELDLKYGARMPDAVDCPNEGTKVRLQQSGVEHKEHGKMVVHGSGSHLVCGVCGATYPIGRIN